MLEQADKIHYKFENHYFTMNLNLGLWQITQDFPVTKLSEKTLASIVLYTEGTFLVKKRKSIVNTAYEFWAASW